jgi:Type ISP C-terminal specificity domain
MEADEERRKELFRETRDRKISRSYGSLFDEAERLPALAALPRNASPPVAVPYAYRSFDRQYCFADSRLGDFLRPVLWRTRGPRQLYMTSLLTGLLGSGPAVTATHLVPDLDHFRGSFGAKHVIPLWRDKGAKQPNISLGVLETLSDELGLAVTPEDLFAYVYAVLSAPAYAEMFAEELEVPGPHVPITKDPELFARSVGLGRRLVWLHTFGERLVPEDARAGEIPPGAARAVVGVGTDPASYPVEHSYNEDRQELRVGAAIFAPVAPGVRRFSVSGLDVVGSWLDYRMRHGAGRRTSPLDDIRPERWTANMTEELLHLLWIIEHTVALHEESNALLTDVLRSDMWLDAGLPAPTDEMREAPDGTA